MLAAMKALRAIFFDLDDTLVDGRPYAQSIHHTCESLVAGQPGLDRDLLIEAAVSIWQEYEIEALNNWTLGVLDGTSVKLEAWRRILRAYGCHDESVAQFATQIHLRFERTSHLLFDDVKNTITTVRNKQIPLALITNGASDTQRDKLYALCMVEWFNAIIISGETGVAKPDPLIFELALNKLCVEPGNVWHVGDDLVTDVAGAKAAALTAVWLNRDRRPLTLTDVKPDFEIQSLRDLSRYTKL
jgi:putative hydrolase of the HAD superfamily